MGRFIQIDPLGELIQQIDKTPYAFAWNNPVLFNDPDGLCPDCPDPANANQGDTYTIANGSVYVFNNGEWERQTVEELDEVVVVPPSVNSEEEDSSTTSEANAGVVGATIATGVILSEVTTGTIILPTVGTMASGAIGAGGAGVGLMPLLFLAHLAENPPPRPFYESLASDPYFPITTQPSPGSSHYAQQTSNITAFPNLTPPAYQPLSVEDQLELSAYINQMAKSKKGRKSKKQEDVQHGNQGNGKLSGAKKKKHQKRRPGDMGDKKRQKPGWKQH